MRWVQDPSQSSVDNLNSARSEAGRHFRNKKKAYLKSKIEELETNISFSILSDDRFKSSSKTIPLHSAI